MSVEGSGGGEREADEEPGEGEPVSGDESENVFDMDQPTEATERAYGRRITWGWRLVAGGLLTAAFAFGIVRMDTLVNNVLQFALLLVAPAGLVLVGSAMIQFPSQTIGRFGTIQGSHDDWNERYNERQNTVQSAGQGILRGVVVVLVSLGLCVGAGVFAF